MVQDYKSNYKDDKPHLLLPITIWFVTGLLTWNFISPQSFWDGILFIIVWVVFGNVAQFLIGSIIAIAIDSFPIDARTPSHLEGAETVISIINMQMMLIGNRNNLPNKARDTYSSGYISGMVDASLYNLGEKDTKKEMATILYALENIFGEYDGSLLFNNVLDLIESKDDRFYLAMNNGGAEFVKFIQGDIDAPHGWLNYVQGYR